MEKTSLHDLLLQFEQTVETGLVQAIINPIVFILIRLTWD